MRLPGTPLRRQPMQEEFDFTRESGPDGVSAWRRGREEELGRIAQANGLPLGHVCRVELLGGVELEGRLHLADEELILPGVQRDQTLRLRIGRCTFTPREILSAVRLD